MYDRRGGEVCTLPPMILLAKNVRRLVLLAAAISGTSAPRAASAAEPPTDPAQTPAQSGQSSRTPDVTAQPAAPAGAASTDPAQAPSAEVQASGARFRFRIESEYDFKGDVDEGGDVSTARVRGALGVQIPVRQYNRLDLDFSAASTFYNFSDAVTLDPDGDPIGAAESFGMSARFLSRLSQEWGWFAGAGIGSSGEPHADFDRTLSYGGGGGLSYFPSRDFSVSLGAFVRTRLEGSPSVAPAIIIDWQITPELNLSTVTRAAGTAPGVELEWAPSKEWAFALGASFESSNYRLDDEGYNPDGVFRERRVPVTASARWNFLPNATLEFGGGISLFHEFRIDDSDGTKWNATSADPAPMLMLHLHVRF